jgi:uncharacterized membrane protein
MSTIDLASITDEYLGRLDAAAWRLPTDRRVELVAEVRDHIGAAMAGRPGDEAALRTVLDNLGAPEEIARAAVEQEPQADAPPALPPTQNANLRDISTVLLLMFGGFLIGIGWLVGVALLWSSTRWRTRDKWLATLVWPFGYAAVFLVGAIAGLSAGSVTACTSSGVVRAGARVHQTCNTSGFSLPAWAGIPIFLVIMVAPVLVAVRLLRQPSTPRAGAAQS